MPAAAPVLLLDGLHFPEGPAFAPDGSLWLVELQGGALVRYANGHSVWFQDQGPWPLWGKDTYDAAAAQTFLHGRGFDTRSLFSEPRFVDAAARDCRLLPDSPLRTMRDATGPVGALP